MKKGLPPHPLSKMFREEDRRIYSTNNFSLRRQAKYHTAGISLFSDTQLKQSKKQTGQNLSAFLYGAVWDEIEVIYAPATPPCLLFCFLPFCPLISVSVLRIFAAGTRAVGAFENRGRGLERVTFSQRYALLLWQTSR